MRNTTFHFLRIRSDGYLFSEATPVRAVDVSRGAGDPGSKARQQIVLLYQGDVYRLVLDRIHSAELAKEAAQDFAVRFLKAEIYQAYDEKKGGFRVFLRAWTLNWIRSRWNEKMRQREVPLEGDGVVDDGQAVEESVDRVVTLRRVTEARRRTMELLGRDSRAWRAFDLWYFGQDPEHPMSKADLAASVGVSEHHIAELLARGEEKILRVLVDILRTEIATVDDLAAELGFTREQLEGALARYWWKPPQKRRGTSAATE